MALAQALADAKEITTLPHASADASATAQHAWVEPSSIKIVGNPLHDPFQDPLQNTASHMKGSDL